MSKYTTEVRFICENYAGLNKSEGQGSVNDIIVASRDKVFDFSFPIYDESYRGVLESKILKHYYTREIGFETVGLWKHFLDMKMNEIMPYYNQLYKSTLLEFNPFYDFDYSTTSNRKVGHEETNNNVRTDNLKTDESGNTTRTDNLGNSGKSVNKYSDTPQGTINNVENGTYLTSANITETSGSNTGTQTVDDGRTTNNTGTQSNEGSRNFNSTDDYLEHVAGKRNGTSYSKLLDEYRKTFLNIDMQVIDDLGELFMNLW